jgi:hypothetical protein
MTYVHQPYPKMLTSPAGARVRVETEEEHRAIEASWAGDERPSRDALLAQATALGIKVDGRWSDRRLSEEIGAAQ